MCQETKKQWWANDNGSRVHIWITWFGAKSLLKQCSADIYDALASNALDDDDDDDASGAATSLKLLMKSE